MERQELYEKALEEQEGRIREMERIISLLEEENSLQRQLIEGLKEENSVLEKQAQKDVRGYSSVKTGGTHADKF